MLVSDTERKQPDTRAAARCLPWHRRRSVARPDAGREPAPPASARRRPRADRPRSRRRSPTATRVGTEARRRRCATSSGRCSLSGAPLGAQRGRPGRGFDHDQRPAAAGDGVAQPGRVPARPPANAQRSSASEPPELVRCREGQKVGDRAWWPLRSERKTLSRGKDGGRYGHELLRSTRPGCPAGPDRRQGALAVAACIRRFAGAPRNRRDHRSVRGAAGRRARPCPRI